MSALSPAEVATMRTVVLFPPFVEFPKISRLSRECVITEKLDGTNGSIYIDETGTFLVGSRTRWITPEQDNYGFARWAYEHQAELVLGLGPGTHFGEWWGSGIQRGYGLKEKRFSLFNTHRWNAETAPPCCHVVPVLYAGPFTTEAVSTALGQIAGNGSEAAPGFNDPEGVVIYHTAARIYFKKTLFKDDEFKGKAS